MFKGGEGNRQDGHVHLTLDGHSASQVTKGHNCDLAPHSRYCDGLAPCLSTSRRLHVYSPLSACLPIERRHNTVIVFLQKNYIGQSMYEMCTIVFA